MDEVGRISKPIFYYLRNESGQRSITVCLIKYKQFFSRGISICSLSDQFDKHIGRIFARRRANIGALILENFEKPLTEKQIKKNRIKKQFVNIQKISRAEALSVTKRTTNLLSQFKISTFDESGLVPFEKELLNKINLNSILVKTKYKRKIQLK